MSIKIFLPFKLFYTKESCDIYGEIQIGESNCISYYVTCAISDAANCYKTADTAIGDFNRQREYAASKKLRHLGYIVNARAATESQRKDVALVFVYDAETPNIYLHKLSIQLEEANNINVFLYEEAFILKLQDLNHMIERRTSKSSQYAKEPKDEDNEAANDDMHMLYQLLQGKAKIPLDHEEAEDFFASDIKMCLMRAISLVFNLVMFLLSFMFYPPFKYVFQHTVLAEHYKEWLKFKNCGKRRFNIVFDTILGLCVMLFIVLYIESPGDYMIKSSQLIVSNFRTLLDSLKGSPIGLKLNVQLNNFLMDCCRYHVDLWAKFLDVIEPCIRMLFVPITFLGSMGLSHQLALLTDIISVIGLHAHCFSIYAAVLYKVEIQGISALWKVVLGKRKNVLKNRVEHHNYKNRQLYLATVFFTCQLFLLPTVVTYYVVFTTLRLGIGFVNYVLKSIRRNILEFPMEMLFYWCIGSFYDTDSLQLEHVKHTPSPLLQRGSRIEMEMCVFRIRVYSSSLGRVLSCHSGV